MPKTQKMIEKAKGVEDIKEFINKYKVIGAANLQKVRAAQLQELRKKLESYALLRVTKNTIMKRAIAEYEDKPKLRELGKYLQNSNIFLFSDINPFKLTFLLKKSKVKTTARAGDTAANDVLVSAGNTGLPPGPIITQLSAVGLPTRIESGSVWINHDTLVAEKGEVISARLASVLSKLGIKPVEVGLTMNVVYDDGEILDEKQLQIDLEETKEVVEEAHKYAFYLSLKAAYPLPENTNFLIREANQQAFLIALISCIPTPDTMPILIRKAHIEMTNLKLFIEK
jgi:large subunit ribosomal protein L10